MDEVKDLMTGHS